MLPLDTPRHGAWPSPAIGIVAIAGASLGLGHLWRFPALVSEHGGAGFVLVYMLALVVLAAPVLLAEFHLGSISRRGPLAGLIGVARHNGVTRWWALGGVCALCAAFVLLVLLCISAAWVLGYLFRLGMQDLLLEMRINPQGVLNAFTLDPERVLFWLTLFIVVVAVVVMNGMRRGIGPAMLFIVPFAGGLLGLLLWRVVADSDWSAVAAAVLPSHLTGVTDDLHAVGNAMAATFRAVLTLGLDAVAAAFQQAFLTLALGVGVMAAFAAGLPQRTRVFGALGAVLVLDLLLVLAVNALLVLLLIDGWQGSALLFEQLPIALSQRAGGPLLVAMLYMFVGLTMLASALALLHVLTMALMDVSRLPRAGATLIMATAVWAAACVVVVFHASAVSLQGAVGMRFLDGLEWTVIWLVPSLIGASALVALVFVGWVCPKRQLFDWIRISEAGWTALLVGGLVRWVAPALLIVMLTFTISGLLTRGTA